MSLYLGKWDDYQEGLICNLNGIKGRIPFTDRNKLKMYTIFHSNRTGMIVSLNGLIERQVKDDISRTQ